MTITTTLASSFSLDDAEDLDNNVHHVLVPDTTTGLPTRVRSNVVITEPEPVTCFYDRACFVGDGFGRAAASLDFWVAQQTQKDLSDQETYATIPEGHMSAQRMFDLHMYTAPFTTDYTETRFGHVCLHEMLANTVEEVYALLDADRGHYLAQVVTRWFSDGTIGFMRFRLANLLARYYSMMPTHADPMGAYEVAVDLTVHGWSTDHGIYLDLVYMSKEHDVHIEDAVAAALKFGNDMWPAAFAGVRYLPLEALHTARLYDLDGTYTEVVQRDLLGEDVWGDDVWGDDVWGDDVWGDDLSGENVG